MQVEFFVETRNPKDPETLVPLVSEGLSSVIERGRDREETVQ